MVSILSRCFHASRTRNSRVEALRLVAILLIVGMHILSSYFETANAANRQFILFWNTIGNAGVSIFVLISGLYGIRFRAELLISFWLLIWTYSLLVLLCQVLFSAEPLTGEALRNALFPIASKRWWFVTSYFLLFILSPVLNGAAEKLGQARFAKVLVLLLFVLVVVPTISLTDPTGDNGKGTIYLIFLYMIGRYCGLYGFPRFIRDHALLLFFTSVVLIFVGNNLISLHKGRLNLYLCHDNSLLILLEALCVVYIAQRKNKVLFPVNVAATFVFPLYLFHGVLLPYGDIGVNSSSLPLYFGVKLFVIFASCVVVEIARRLLLGRLTEKASYSFLVLSRRLASFVVS